MIRRSFSVDLGGRLLQGHAFVPDGPPPRSAVLLAHGFLGSPELGILPRVRTALVGEGWAVVSFTFSGAGLGGDPRGPVDLDVFASATHSRELDELQRMLRRTRAGLDLTRRPERVGVFGYGRGGGGAILAAAEGRTGADGDPAVDALVTWAAPARFDRWNPSTRQTWVDEGRVYVLDRRSGCQLPLDVSVLEDFEAHRDRLDILAAAGRIEAPWLIAHGTRDERVDESDARELAERAGPAARLLLVEGTGHDFESGFPATLEATLRHFRRHLSPIGSYGTG